MMKLEKIMPVLESNTQTIGWQMYTGKEQNKRKKKLNHYNISYYNTD